MMKRTSITRRYALQVEKGQRNIEIEWRAGMGDSPETVSWRATNENLDVWAPNPNGVVHGGLEAGERAVEAVINAKLRDARLHFREEVWFGEGVSQRITQSDFREFGSIYTGWEVRVGSSIRVNFTASSWEDAIEASRKAIEGVLDMQRRLGLRGA